MRQKINAFLKVHWDRKSPLLLGYSGGKDSKCLLYLLLEIPSIPLHVAHVNHGWREESALEQEEIRKEIASLRLPFHTVTLEKGPLNNREERAREGRLEFFQSLLKEHPFQALLLAHQREDLAETVLKRLFEGASLEKLFGMKEVSSIGPLPIWRPLLKVGKETILSFLTKKNLSFFSDATNQDPTYLRARMREELIPFLEKSFQKKITSNLVAFSERSVEFGEFVEKTPLPPIEKGDRGWSADFNGLSKIEARLLLQKLASQAGTFLPRALLEEFLEKLFLHRPFAKALWKQWWILLSRGKIFFSPIEKKERVT